MRKFLIPVVLFFAFIIAPASNADVFINDVRTNSEEDFNNLFSGTIESGAGDAGDFVMISCGINTDGFNLFSPPAPGDWMSIGDGLCTNGACQQQVSGRFIGAVSSEEITCAWTNPASALVAASIRYRQVDPVNPVIDAGCSETVGENVIIPAISSEPGAQVVFLQLVTLNTTQIDPPEDFLFFNDTDAAYGVLADLNDVTILFLGGESNFDEDGEGFPEQVVPLSDLPDGLETSFCVVSLRMGSDQRSVPSISEWGLICFAALAGITGLFFIRRRRAFV